MGERIDDTSAGAELDPQSAELADLVSLLPEEYGFDPDTLREITEMPFDDGVEGAVRTVISYLDSDGRIDGEKFLIGAGFLEPPEPGGQL
jgi:hypothetical protein